MYIYTADSNNSILDPNSVSICRDNYLFYVDRWLIKKEECIFRFAIMKKKKIRRPLQWFRTL